MREKRINKESVRPTSLFLDELYVLDGVKLSGQDIKDAIIDSSLLKEELEKLGGK